MKKERLKQIQNNATIQIGKIVIEKDGWVWVETRDRKHEMGLGDINVDVVIIDKRKKDGNNILE